MTSHDLGHGVSIIPYGEDGWRVASRRLTLPWTPRAENHPGSAVLWRGQAYEVVGGHVSGCERGWILEPWPDPEVMRAVFRLDEDWIGSHAAAEEEQRRNRLIRRVSLPAAPLLALAPARLQRQWRDSWGFPAAGATLVSAICELAAGGVGVVQLLVIVSGSEWFLPEPVRWIAVIGPALSAEALVRLACAARSEPIGSFLGLPLALVPKSAPVEQHLSRPEVSLEGAEGGGLEIVSDVLRRDWVPDGVLRYRGDAYRLAGLENLGSGWRYRFERTDSEASGPQLHLARIVERSEARERARSPSLVRTTIVSAVTCMAPSRYQERWARHLGVRPVWFTLLGAGSELLGGWINLEHGSSVGASPSLSFMALNLFFVVEAVVRLALLVLTGKPIGSVFGWAVQPLLEKMMPEEHDGEVRE